MFVRWKAARKELVLTDRNGTGTPRRVVETLFVPVLDLFLEIVNFLYTDPRCPELLAFLFLL
jgi:hypothetical protein